MGRNRYTPQERNKITATFIRCTREIIDLEGIQQVSIRKVAQTAGLNSATLYLYFDDADELITLAVELGVVPPDSNFSTLVDTARTVKL